MELEQLSGATTRRQRSLEPKEREKEGAFANYLYNSGSGGQLPTLDSSWPSWGLPPSHPHSDRWSIGPSASIGTIGTMGMTGASHRASGQDAATAVQVRVRSTEYNSAQGCLLYLLNSTSTSTKYEYSYYQIVSTPRPKHQISQGRVPLYNYISGVLRACRRDCAERQQKSTAFVSNDWLHDPGGKESKKGKREKKSLRKGLA